LKASVVELNGNGLLDEGVSSSLGRITPRFDE
jgi:hypothetical protein